MWLVHDSLSHAPQLECRSRADGEVMFVSVSIITFSFFQYRKFLHPRNLAARLFIGRELYKLGRPTLSIKKRGSLFP